MIISGQFPFLHRLNVAWLLKAGSAARAKTQLLHVKLLPEHVSLDAFEDTRTGNTAADASIERRAQFLSAFGFADTVTKWETGDPVPGDIPVPHDATDIERIIDAWVIPRKNRLIYLTPDRFMPELDALQSCRRITTNGCFDILHPGHLVTLRYAASLGDRLIVLINSDQSVRRFKGTERPVHSERFRAALLSCLDCVDYVVVFNEDTPLALLEQIRPHGHVKGGSFIPERIREEQETVARWGGRFHAVPMHGSHSTSAILEHFSAPPFPV
ncbi:MAG TPA: adenylyltransferase/cytidyltransferase family protein [bacterium]|nr:adenylyltransferase/cytidyltransferase family protein [bacterium]